MDSPAGRVLLPLGVGLASAATPGLARGAAAGFGVAGELQDRKRLREAMEEEKRQKDEARQREAEITGRLSEVIRGSAEEKTLTPPGFERFTPPGMPGGLNRGQINLARLMALQQPEQTPGFVQQQLAGNLEARRLAARPTTEAAIGRIRGMSTPPGLRFQMETQEGPVSYEAPKPTKEDRDIKVDEYGQVTYYDPETGKVTRRLPKREAPRQEPSNVFSRDDAQAIADSIEQGEQPPTLQGLYRNAAAVRAELARRDYPLARAMTDWNATQRHLSTLNGPQQERLRQAIQFTYESTDIIEKLYGDWSKLARAQTGFKALNKGALAASKNLPGEAGAIANTLEAQINDLVSELGTVYKGGNTSTDESLRLAAGNLKAEWNAETFKKALQVIRQGLKIRKNSILSSQAVGISPGSPYLPSRPPPESPVQTEPSKKPPAPEGTIVRMPDGGRRVKRDGAWVPVQ